MRSRQLFETAQKFIPGGVNSPVRAFKAVASEPPFIKRGEGAYIFDADGNKYIDYVGSWGPLIAGHGHPHVVESVSRALKDGFSFGAPTEVEVKLAEKVCALMPSIEKVRFVSSGTEAAMSALRLARGFTSRKKIIKFIGGYHGHADALLVAAGSGGLTLNLPASAGVPQEVVADTLLAQYNELAAVEALFSENIGQIAAVIVEPVAGNMNCVLPTPDFLAGLRRLCDAHSCLLIFDEVITGFRVALGGAQSYYGIKPDLTVLGKIIGGGFPAAAFGGAKEIMDELAPLGPVYQAGTLSGNPIAMTAGLATLDVVSERDFYSNLSATKNQLINGISDIAKDNGIPLHTQGIGGMFGLFFTNATEIKNELDVKACNLEYFKQFFHGMLKAGIYLAPSAFEAGFVSSAHGREEIDQTLSAVAQVFKHIKDST